MKLYKTYCFSTTAKKILNQSTISPNLIKAEYAVRGYIPTLAASINQELKTNPQKYSFTEIIQLNIGNPLIFNTKPIWTFRQIAANAINVSNVGQKNEHILDSSACNFMTHNFPGIEISALLNDYENIASSLQTSVSNQYRSPYGGHFEAKRAIANMIEARDTYPSDPSKIFLSNGASSIIRLFFEFLINAPEVGILIPIPQYPLYSALITLFNGQNVPYYLNEEDNWNITLNEMEKAYTSAINKGIKPRAVVLINPGNPTGNVLTRSAMEQIVQFAYEKNLVLLADEVYQENIYGNRPWFSFKKVLAESPKHIAEQLELISFHSLSKGILGECGLRGGYVELVNLNSEFAKFFEQTYASTWPNVMGQLFMTLKCKFLSGELENEISKQTFDTLKSEYQQLYESLKFKAFEATLKLNAAKNIKCNPIDGAMYAFPQINLPPRLIEAAKLQQLKPDVYYCKLLLEKSGICVVPGSGFGQKDGTFHFRTTILPSPNDYFASVFEKLTIFNNQIMNEHS